MASLAEIKEHAAQLSSEERESLLAYLIHLLPGTPLGPDDEEVERCQEELNSGVLKGLSHEEFLDEGGRR